MINHKIFFFPFISNDKNEKRLLKQSKLLKILGGVFVPV